MFNFNIRLSWPWIKSNRIVDYFVKDWSLTRHKNLEIQIARGGCDTIFQFRFNFSWRGHDHAGPSIKVNLFGFWIEIQIYDSRHWNYDANAWETYPT